MARSLGQSITRMADLVECFQYAVVGTDQMWSKEEPVNQYHSHGLPKLTDAY